MKRRRCIILLFLLACGVGWAAGLWFGQADREKVTAALRAELAEAGWREAEVKRTLGTIELQNGALRRVARLSGRAAATRVVTVRTPPEVVYVPQDAPPADMGEAIARLSKCAGSLLLCQETQPDGPWFHVADLAPEAIGAETDCELGRTGDLVVGRCKARGYVNLSTGEVWSPWRLAEPIAPVEVAREIAQKRRGQNIALLGVTSRGSIFAGYVRFGMRPRRPGPRRFGWWAAADFDPTLTVADVYNGETFTPQTFGEKVAVAGGIAVRF